MATSTTVSRLKRKGVHLCERLHEEASNLLMFNIITCTPDGNAGVCTACSLSCHDGHEPDPDAEEQVEMIQCCICEDWFHEEHLGLGNESEYKYEKTEKRTLPVRKRLLKKMVARRMSSLLSSSYAPALLRSLDRHSGRATGITRFNTTVALEEPITPPVKVEYTKLLINGEFIDAASGKTFPTLDPRIGQLIVDVAEGDLEDVNRAVAAARKAFDEGPWPRMTAYAGLPPGVLNIVSGYGPSAGADFASHMEVDKLAFTGSTETGKIVLGLAAKINLKPVTLELGCKSPFIVCEDANVDEGVELAHATLFYNQGII
ncbi:hypothetical protein L2E82_42101 [Cichorium intybus]|uniref:Uncharacterized protein n=1 Tax=Cichorium intybus TaxID=13427 RepID=A0ACB8ZLS9_CICIN|nr:hypothetical protein L2E82_42101 [Cichorium intybus]